MTFAQIKVGDAFEYKGSYYRAIEPLRWKNWRGEIRRANAVSVYDMTTDGSTSRTQYLAPNAAVRKLTDEELRRR